MRRLLILLSLLSAPALAAEIDISLGIPRIDAAEYHRPYVAVWVETADHAVAADLAVWYQQKETKEGAGTKWLADLRQWWRRSGRNQSLPIDGVSGATRPVGQHHLHFDTQSGPFAKLAAGQYELVIEAAREVGGRELLRIPFTWPAAADFHQQVQGKTELGTVSLDIHP